MAFIHIIFKSCAQVDAKYQNEYPVLQMSAPLSMEGWLASLIAITLTGQCQSQIKRERQKLYQNLAWICAKYRNQYY